MDLFFEVQRNKTHLYIDAKEADTVQVLKKMIEGILKISPEDQRLYWHQSLDAVDGAQSPADDWSLHELADDKSLSNCGFSSSNARAQAPQLLALACREDGKWEEPELTSLSIPPPLPDVMRQGNENEAQSSDKR